MRVYALDQRAELVTAAQAARSAGGTVAPIFGARTVSGKHVHVLGLSQAIACCEEIFAVSNSLPALRRSGEVDVRRMVRAVRG
jgi:hypothetical protein